MIGNVVQTAGLDTSGSSALETAAAGVVDQSVKDARGKLADALADYLVQYAPEQRGPIFDQIDNDPKLIVKKLVSSTGLSPADAPAWEAALKKALSPAQYAVWAAAKANHQQAVETQIAGFLAGLAKSASSLAQREIQPQAVAVRSMLNLPPDRLAKLNALESSAAADFGKSLRAKYEKPLRGMTDDDRNATIKRIGIDYPAMALDEWNTGLAKILTPDELRVLQTAKADRAAARARALGRLMLALMDERVAFTSAQRALLEPLAPALVDASPNIATEPYGDVYFSIAISQLLAAGNGSEQDQIKAILDANQWQHWQDAAAGKNLPDDMDEEQTLQLPAADSGSTTAPQPAAEPEAVDRAISKYMADQSKTERQKVFAEKLLKAEDAARILHLPPDSAQRLETAACGAADAFMTGWSDSAEQTVRANLGTISADTIEQRLQCIQGYQLEQAEANATTGTPQDTVWDHTVKNLLSQDQMRAWKAETDARERYENDAIGGWITVSFAQRFALSPDQAARLKPMVMKVIEKDSAPFANYFQDSTPWYLQTYSIFLPLIGIDDHKLSSILTEDQIARWKSSPYYGQASMYWQNMSLNTH